MLPDPSVPPAQRPFRFGVSFAGAPTREAWLAKVRRAEDLGFDVLYASDHFLPGSLPPFPALAAAAVATERIRLGTLVANVAFHNPAFLAWQAAALDVLSGGRFELGLGAGHMRSEFEAADIPFLPAGERIAHLERTVERVRGLLAGAVPGLGTPPVQQPLPLLIGGNGRRVLTLAGRLADIVGFTGFFPTEDGAGVNLSHFTRAALESRVAIVRAAAGSRLAAIELNALVQVVRVTEHREAVAGRLAAAFPGLTANDLLESPFVLLGTEEQIAAELRERRVSLGISSIAVFEPAMEALARVIPLLRGE